MSKPYVIRDAAYALNYEEPILVVIKDGYLDFVGEKYWIEIDRIKTVHDVVEWIHHLLGKSWITHEMLEQFIEKVYEYRKWKIYRNV